MNEIDKKRARDLTETQWEFIKKLKDSFEWEGNFLQKICLLLFIVNLIIAPIIYNVKNILGDHYSYTNYFFKYNNYGFTYEEMYLWVFTGLILSFSIYLFRGNEQ